MAVTLAELRLRARALADQIDDDSVDDDVWDGWIDDGIKALYRRVTAADPDAYYTTADFTLEGGASGNTFALPATFATFLGLTKDPTLPTRVSIPKFNFSERNDVPVCAGPYRYPFTQYPCDRVRRYRVLGSNLVIEPFEYAAGNYRLHFRQLPTKLTGDDDTLDVVLEPWSEYVVCFAVRKTLGREESETSEVTTRLRELEAEIAVSTRDVTADALPDPGW